MPSYVSSTEVVPQRSAGWMAAWAAVLVAGLAAWLACALEWDPPRAWRALLINFIFFTPMAAGMVVWPALLTAARAGWLRTVARSALIGVGFAPASIAAFIVLWIGRGHWAPWVGQTELHNAAWLNEPFMLVRDAAVLAVMWVLAAVYVSRIGRLKTRLLPAWLIFTYAIVFTVLAFDLVMALDPHWFSTLFGGYFFVSGMYAAVAAWTLMVLLQRPAADVERRHDLGRLIVVFSLLTTYMMYSQLIVIWYANLPEEVRFVIPRLTRPPWQYASAALLAVIYLGPLVLLLLIRAKRSPRFLGAVAAAVLIGMWLERWWLVTPTLGGELVLGMAELSITAAFVAAFALGAAWIARLLPAEIPMEVRQA